MKILLIGDGKVGNTITERLVNENHDIVIIDTNPEVIQTAVNTYDVNGIVGNGAGYSILQEAGADKADILIATASSDELNILACLIAAKMGTKHTIARVRNPEYAKQHAFFRNELGISMIINPEYETATEIYRILRFPSAMKLDVFCKGRVEMIEINIGTDSILNNVALINLYEKIGVKVIISAVQRDGLLYIPKGDFVLKDNDTLHITASHKDLSDFIKTLGIFKERLKNIFIVGGGKIAYYLTNMLEEGKMHSTIVEQEQKRCEELSQSLSKARIICGDGTNQMLLDEENMASADAVVSLMGIDEENIVLSLYAQRVGVSKTITKINNSHLVDMLGAILQQSSVISPKKVTTDRIVRYVRALQKSEGSKVNTLYSIVHNKAEALEFVITDPDLPFLGVKIKELKFKQDILISCIIRGSKLIYPTGEDTIEVNDHVVVTAPAQKYINEFSETMG